MFGSKNNKTKKNVNVKIKTMEGDIKGEGDKNLNVEYEDTLSKAELNSEQKDGDLIINKEKKETKTESKAPFSKKLPGQTEEAPMITPTTPPNTTATKGLQGTFNGGMAEKNTSKNQLSSELSKKEIFNKTNQKPINNTSNEKTPFLHQATNKDLKKGGSFDKKKTMPPLTKKKESKSSLIFVILFIFLLAGILLGGYYFYMKKSQSIKKPTKVTQDDNNNQNKNKNNTQKNTNNNSKQNNTTNQETRGKALKFITTENTLLADLQKFIQEINTPQNQTTLNNGVIVTPMINDQQALSSTQLLTALNMTNFFKSGELKLPCKLFIMKDNGKIKTAIIFELAEGVDDKLIRENIVKNETTLPETIKVLFLDEEPPTIQGAVKFSVNPENKNSRYFNYQPGNTFQSVDWNILDLGKGKLIYFATSRNLAEKVTDYFMNLVMK